MQIRTPVVAGMFYPSNAKELKQTIHDCFLHPFGPGKIPPTESDEKIFGVICPHAGYMYSGPIACHSYYSISAQSVDVVVILGPNHWGIGCSVASMKEGLWQTPLGEVRIDSDSAEEIANLSKRIELDYFSHTKDHSLEVQIPMLQEIYRNGFKILPIILIDQEIHAAKEIGIAVSKLAKKKKIMIVGSSDFTHYEQNEFAYKQDHALIEPILKLDLEQFYNTLHEKQVSACGYGAIASTMVACKELGATKGKLLKYATSGDVAGDKSSVVGYASIIFT
jgi:hypothetical protein